MREEDIFYSISPNMVSLTNSYKEELKGQISHLAKDNLDIKSLFDFARDNIPNVLADIFRTHIEDNEGDGYIIVKNLPDNYPDELLVVLNSIIGTPIQYQQEGPMVIDIKPQKAYDKKGISYRTSNEFGFHTDLSYAPIPPDFLSLLAIKQDLHQQAKNKLATVKKALKQLPQEAIEELKKAQYQFSRPAHFSSETKTINNLAILTETETGYMTRFREDTISSPNPAAMEAFSLLCNALENVSIKVQLEPFTLIFLDNLRIVHGRTSFEPTYDENDRHLKRVFSTRDINQFGSHSYSELFMVTSG
jgi:alpha-ketoglutarate-dependent taurine dioxygenase